jgi:hypothetical protein
MDPGADFEDVFEPGPSWKGTGAVASAAAGEAIVLLEDEAPTLPGAPFPRPQVSAPLPPGGVESPLRGPVDNPAASPWSVADVAAEADIEPPLHATSTAAPAAIPVPGQGTIEEPPPLPVFAPASLGPSSPEPGLPEPGPALSTPTMAELYFDQGFFARAIAVYEEILEREPSNERARARLIEIGARARTLDGPPAPDPRGQRRQAIERTISRLEQMLAAVRRG